MSRIEDTLTQDSIADSILDDSNIVGSHREGPLVTHEEQESNAERLADQSTDRGDGPLSEEETQQLAGKVAKPGERFERESERQQPEESAPQQTPQSVQEGLERLDSVIQQHQLNDPESAKAFHTELCAAFGTSAFESPCDVEKLGSTMAKTAFSAMQVYEALKGDPSQLGPMPLESAQAFTYDFLTSFGADPRTTQVDAQLLAETVLRGALNFYDTYQRFGGRVTEIGKLNDPVAAEWFLGSFLKAFGIEGRIDRGTALRFADAGSKYLLSFMTRVNHLQPQQQATGARQSQRRGRKEWRTNSDIFDGAQQMLNEEKTGRNSRGFDPRQRAARSRFQSNQDIFDDETMASFDRL